MKDIEVLRKIDNGIKMLQEIVKTLTKIANAKTLVITNLMFEFTITPECFAFSSTVVGITISIFLNICSEATLSTKLFALASTKPLRTLWSALNIVLQTLQSKTKLNQHLLVHVLSFI